MGTTGAQTGPNAFLGRDILTGIQTYESGPGAGSLQVVALDDGYRPSLAARNVAHLATGIGKSEGSQQPRRQGVDLMLGAVGTPTVIASIPEAAKHNLLMLAPFTGAQCMLRPTRQSGPDGASLAGPDCRCARDRPADERVVINYRASYRLEVEALVDELMRQGVRPFEVGFVLQDDCYGADIWKFGLRALRKHGLNLSRTPPALGLLQRNGTSSANAIIDIATATHLPRAVLIAGGYRSAAQVIGVLQRAHPTMKFGSVSFVDSYRLGQELGSQATETIVSQVVPFPLGDTPIAASFRRDFKQYTEEQGLDATATRTVFEGYIVAKLLDCVWKHARGSLRPNQDRRSALRPLLERVASVDIGLGRPLHYERSTRSFSDRVWLTRHANGRFVPMDVDTKSEAVSRPVAPRLTTDVCKVVLKSPAAVGAGHSAMAAPASKHTTRHR